MCIFSCRIGTMVFSKNIAIFMFKEIKNKMIYIFKNCGICYNIVKNILFSYFFFKMCVFFFVHDQYNGVFKKCIKFTLKVVQKNIDHRRRNNIQSGSVQRMVSRVNSLHLVLSIYKLSVYNFKLKIRNFLKLLLYSA